MNKPKMTATEFEKYAKDFFQEMLEIIFKKGHDYTRDTSDRLENFKSQAKALGLSPMQIWGVLFNKHVAAVMTFCRTGKVESEAIRGRFLDIAVYSILGAALAEECNDENGSDTPD